MHDFPSSTLTGVPARQAPAWQVSVPLQRLPSEQLLPLAVGVWTGPVAGSQVSVVHELPSSRLGGAPATQEPDALHVSVPLQALLSGHAVPAVTGVCVTVPETGSQLSVVHALLSLTLIGAPATQVPVELHVSLPLQALPSEQLVPLVFGAWLTPVVGLHASVVQGLLSSTTGGVPATHAALASHVSVPLHALPSEHEVPTVTGVCVTPLAGAHASVVHGLLSFTVGAVPATQVPVALHVSAPLQALPSEQLVPVLTGVCVTAPVELLQASVVHGLPSSVATGVPVAHAPAALQVSAPLHALPSEQLVPVATGVWVTPVEGLHASVVHELPSSVATGVPATHVPLALQVSVPLQAFPSEQLVPALAGVCVTAPVEVLHASVVQGLPSSVATGVPAAQAPLALQVSAPLQAFPSEQLVPVLTGVCVTAPVEVLHASVVHGLLSSVATGVPATQAPAELQVSVPLHAFPSEQVVPVLTGVCVTAPVEVLQASVVHGLLSSVATGVPATQVPLALQVSVPLQAFPSEQLVPVLTGTCVTAPVEVLHASVVQGLLSSVATGVPAAQWS